ncbi:hypothetical protein PCI56_22920 [Plesiomonas shigelloides subsp. oncorhynchi]|nr:hypothetical protein [Plesiomonas shigelloides]
MGRDYRDNTRQKPVIQAENLRYMQSFEGLCGQLLLFYSTGKLQAKKPPSLEGGKNT